MPAKRRLNSCHAIGRWLPAAVMIVGGLAGCASPWPTADPTESRPVLDGNSTPPMPPLERPVPRSLQPKPKMPRALRPTQSYRSAPARPAPSGVIPASYRSGAQLPLPSYPQALHVPVRPQPVQQSTPPQQPQPMPAPRPEFDPMMDYRTAPIVPGPMISPMASPESYPPPSAGPAYSCVKPRWGVMCGEGCGVYGCGASGGRASDEACWGNGCFGALYRGSSQGTRNALDWSAAGPIPWETFGPGEYAGPARTAHLPEYRLRVDDKLEFVYRLTGEVSAQPYRLNIGDQIRIEVLTDARYDRELLIQPDGMITVPQYGQVRAAGHTIAELRDELEVIFREALHLREPGVTVTPINLNTTLDELRSTVDGRYGSGGQTRRARVTPEGTVQLPAIGSVYAQGLSLAELKQEIEHRYAEIVSGVEITPILAERAPRFVYVVGEVRAPGRFQLEGPTSVMQALSLAGSWNPGAKLESVIVLRRDENWNLMATRLNLRDAFFGRQPCPPDEVWLRDSDIVIVPKTQIQWTGDLIELFFTRGIYGILPIGNAIAVNNLSVL